MSAAVLTMAAPLPSIDPRNRAIGLALGDPSCTHCAGRGVREYGERLCGCVQRRIWRACWWRAEIVEAVAWPRIKRTSGSSFTLPAQEYAADLWIIARRALAGRPPDYLRVLELRCRGLDWRQGCRLLSLAKGDWYHRLYKAEEVAGQACLDARPHALYPIDQYFSGRELPSLLAAPKRNKPVVFPSPMTRFAA